MNNILIILIERREELIKAIIEHIKISFLALIIALLIAIPLGIYLSYHKKIAEIIIGITAILQTVPSLALLGLLIPFVGIGGVPAVIALVIYALLPILRNTYTGITEVDPVYMLASRAMGMNKLQQLIKIQIPLAMPVIMAGIRTATVLIIGTATLASLIGAGGLGSLILLGLDRNNNSLILLGAVPAALLAVLFDFILKKFEKADWKKILVCIFAIMVLFFAGNIGADKMMKKNKLIIAGKLGTEPEILINMYKILIEENMDNIDVELKSGFGKTSFVFNALKSGEIDIYPEFTGTAVFTFLKENPVSNDAVEVYSQAKKGMAEKFDMIYLSPMKFNDTYALAVPQKFAEENNLMKISDLEKIKDKIKAGFTREFNDREDGYKGLKKLYGFELPDIKEFEPKLRYVAIQNGDINLIDAYSTDSELAKYNLVVLEDDKKLFPPYQGAPLLRKDTLKKYPQLETILGKLQNKITDAEMREMNYEVGVDGKRAEDIAREYLKKNGLIK
jgi:glycine betaine/choline ABC transporter, ATP-binding protein